MVLVLLVEVFLLVVLVGIFGGVKCIINCDIVCVVYIKKIRKMNIKFIFSVSKLIFLRNSEVDCMVIFSGKNRVENGEKKRCVKCVK